MTTQVDFVTALARRWAVEVNMVPAGPNDWQPLIGIEEFKPALTSRREADESYDDEGATRQAITGSSWKAEIKLIHRAATDGVTMNAVHEYLRGLNDAADAYTGEAHVRWFDRSGTGEAYEGRCLVTWTPDGGNGAARDTVAVVFDGQGAREAITNPNASALPVISSLSPTGGGTAGGTLVTIKGRKLTGATVVSFGGTNATAYTILDDTRIVAVAPAKTAGSVRVLVTTPAGSTADTAADDFLYA